MAARKYPRIRVSFPVEIVSEGKTIRGHASTLGGGGLFLQQPLLFSPGTEIQLRFRPARHLETIETQARSLYMLEGRGTGVEFTKLDPNDHQRLLRLIHQRTKDRRLFPRVPLATQIYCHECMTLAFSRDLCEGGMFIETRQPLEVGSQIHVRFNLEDGGPIVVASAKVCYVVEKLGMGVEFLELVSADRTRIQRYASNLPAPPAAGEKP
jgi:c-di-GMP-binding flagellar brake protein YcgR